MKKIILALSLMAAVMTTACGNSQSAPAESKAPVVSMAQGGKGMSEHTEKTPVILVVNGKQMHAWLNDSVPAKSLLSQLPMTVKINDSGNDFCGDNINVQYSEKDVQNGYRNGDIAFWPPAHNFVIFKNGEEQSSGIGDLVILGHIDEPQSALDALSGTLEVKVEKAGGAKS
ncbi:MAG TPA: cyclophilin-like fold protein [Veillonellaceae bacterium]|nr:cyclophilin-like fold protein [Veillonellaceae bacterium]